MHDHVVRRVERFAVELVGTTVAFAAVLVAHDTAIAVLAGNLAALRVEVLPLLFPLGWWMTLTWPSSSSQRHWRSLGMSLHTRYRPPLCQAVPSAQSEPVCSRWIEVLPSLYLEKRGSRTRMSGSG